MEQVMEKSVNPKKTKKSQPRPGRLATEAFENEMRLYFESIIQAPTLYIEVQKIAEPYVYLDLRNLIVLLIYETLHLNRWVKICVVSKQRETCSVNGTVKSSLLRLKSSVIFLDNTMFKNCNSLRKQPDSNDMFNNLQRTHPSISVIDKKLIICGLSSVLRFIFKYSCYKIESQKKSNEEDSDVVLLGKLKQFLGFRGNCLHACAESSVWTKFCEVDMIDAVNEFSIIMETLQNGGVSSDVKIPDAIMRFEHHLSLPVRIHNYRKVVQDIRKNEKSDKGLEELKSEMENIQIADLNHDFAEGPTLFLSDLILFPSVYACILVLGRTKFENLLPLGSKWFDRVQTHFTSLDELVVVAENSDIQISWTIPELNVESLYSRDPARYKPTLRQFTRQYEIDEALQFIESSNVSIFEILEEDPCFNWADIPLLAHPEAGSLPVSRQSRKCEQLASMAYYALKVYSKKVQQCNYNRPFKIVDFCSGGGHLGILVAWLLPQSEVILVENKEDSLRRAQERIKNLGLSNVYFYQSNLDYFEGEFDLGMALHACGTATDLVLKKSVDANASFVCCPCCYGAMQENHILNYPRSANFNDIKISPRNYFILCHSSDHTHDEAHEKTNQGKQCMAIVDTDRCLYAQDNGYEVKLCKIVPATASPKNHILVGISPSKN